MSEKNNIINPISRRGKTAILTPESNDTELKKFDFSQKPMGVPPIPFWGLEMAKKGVSIAFLLSAVPISES